MELLIFFDLLSIVGLVFFFKSDDLAYSSVEIQLHLEFLLEGILHFKFEL